MPGPINADAGCVRVALVLKRPEFMGPRDKPEDDVGV
jgi:hypothetical protein